VINWITRWTKAKHPIACRFIGVYPGLSVAR